MSFNGSGTFVINSAGQPVVANTVISATVFNALTSDLATGLSTCITKDGQTTVTANIPFGSNKITGLGAGTVATDAANLGQVQSTAAKLITVTGTDTITGTMSPVLTAYAAGQLFYFISNGTNTGAMTINIDGLGAKAITRDGSTALIAGDVVSGEIVVICYDGTRFQMINAANSFGNTTINGTLTVTGDTALQANVSVTSALTVNGTFGVTGAATLGSTLSVAGKSDLPTVSTASMNAAVAVVTTGTVTNLTSTSASIASMNAGVALLTTATVTTLTASGASIASANIGNLQFTAASIASINAGVAVINNLTATSASIASANVGTAVITTGTLTSLTATSASIASMNAGVALLTTATVTNLTATEASIASANAGNLQVTGASVASANVGVALITTGTITSLTATGASVASANVGTAVVTGLTVTNASIASLNAGTATITTGNLTFSSTAQRITGDMSNATFSSRLAFQSSTTNGNTTVNTLPNGTATTSQYQSYNAADPTNSSLMSVGVGPTEMQLQSAIRGTGTYLPMTFYTSGSERMRLDTSGNLGIGTNSPNQLLQIEKSQNSLTGINIYNANAGASAEAGVYMRNSTSGSSSGGGAYVTLTSGNTLQVWNVFGNPITFGTNNAQRMQIDGSGNVGIGGTAGADTKVLISGTLPTSGTVTRAVLINGTIPSGSTGAVVGFNSPMSTQAASFTLGNLTHFSASQGTIGSGSAITNQYGFSVDSGLTGATNNYGFYGNIASGSNRWNFYAAGTAQNYFAGNTGVGVSPTYRLQVDNSSASTGTDAFVVQNSGVTTNGHTAGMRFRFSVAEPAAIRAILTDAASGAGALGFYTSSDGTGANLTERMRITSGGEAYIAGTTDQGAYNLQCNGTGVWGAGAYVNGSDARLKDDITTLNDGLNVVSQLRPVTFKYKPDYSKDQNVQTGFIAQELQAVLAGKDYVDGIVQAGPNHLNVAYQSLIPILVKAIQELTARVAELEAK